VYKAGKGAQEAHEAVRPTYADRTPESLKGELDGPRLKLYTLIWQRFVASQMVPAIFDSTSIEISALPAQAGGTYTFGANGQILKFDGFLKVYPMKFSENEMPDLKEKEIVDLVNLESTQHFTEPPARYNEASLIKALEKHGIGRPSTYAPTLTTVQERNYIAKNEQKRFYPTEMGIIVNKVLVENFPEIVDIDFTAKMEKELDEIAEGKDTWRKTIKDFYTPFEKNLAAKYEEVKKQDTDIKTDKVCPKCGKPMIEKLGRFGRFYACTGFPECKHTESIVTEGASAKAITLDITCPKCGKGNMAAKKTKRGKIFYGCDQYPACDMATWDKPINEFCPTCKSILVETKKGQVKCSSKECDYKR
jgi:DNA topoisomerase-1